MNIQRSHAITKIIESREQDTAIGLLYDYVKKTESKIHNHNKLYKRKLVQSKFILDNQEYAIYVNTCKLFDVEPLKPQGLGI